jgi:hypothetical protein
MIEQSDLTLLKRHQNDQSEGRSNVMADERERAREKWRKRVRGKGDENL